VPEPGLPFLGVHFTEQMAGFTTIGPSAVMALSREGYRWGAIKPKELFEILSFSGIWKMIFKYFNHTVDELRGSLFTGHYLKHVQRYIPEITRQDLLPYPAGVRAQAMSLQGELISDFLFMSSKRTLHVCNAPSPAATSSLPIGQHVIEQLMAQMF
jgi:L-2-hydroxyglutarate oxidase